MSLDFLVWLLVFFIQLGLLGITMYILITLSDLEADYLNPHDSSVIVNYWLAPEYIAQGAITVLLLLTGKWVSGLVSLALTAYHVRAYLRQEHQVDVTEVFRQIPRQKVIRIVKLIIYLIAFVYFIFRVVHTAVTSLLSPQGRQAVHKLFQDAAASMTILSLVHYFDAAYPVIDRRNWEAQHTE